MSDSWHSYPSIFALGHRALAELLLDPVIVEEKIDGSQFSFGMFERVAVCDEPPELVLQCRSKGAQLNIIAPEKMFIRAVDVVKELPLTPGWTYRAEYLLKPKHNALAYDRIPEKHLMVFDINTGHEEYMPYDQKAAECARLGLETVPLVYEGMLDTFADFRSMLDRVSALGGQKIEGVVVKNYCVTPDQRTLTADLHWTPVGDLSVGDDLIAFTESSVGRKGQRYFTPSKVTHAARSQAEVFEVVLSDGTTLRATGNHPFLIRSSGKVEYVWREVRQLKGNEQIRRILPTWNTDNSYEAGYVAGIFDGEGHMIHRQSSLDRGVVEIGFSQLPGVVADTTLQYLTQMGCTWSQSKPGNSSTNKYYLTGGKWFAIKFLGSVRPRRLLEKVRIDALGCTRTIAPKFLTIVCVRSIGIAEIVELETTSGTYLTEGFGSHNSRFGPDKKVLMGKFVSEAFKEVHGAEWKVANPSKTDIVDKLIDTLRTPARWNKAVQHLRERGEITDSPRDIGFLIKEVQADVEKECMDLIAQKLAEWALPQIRRGVVRGLPEHYKEDLLKRQFNQEAV